MTGILMISSYIFAKKLVDRLAYLPSLHAISFVTHHFSSVSTDAGIKTDGFANGNSSIGRCLSTLKNVTEPIAASKLCQLYDTLENAMACCPIFLLGT